MKVRPGCLALLAGAVFSLALFTPQTTSAQTDYRVGVVPTNANPGLVSGVPLVQPEDVPVREIRLTPGIGSGNGISYLGGPVMTGPNNVYFIWYGNWPNTDTTMTILPQLISGLSRSSYMSMAEGYSNNSSEVSNVLNMSTQVTDVYSLGSTLNDSTLQQVVTDKFAAKLLPVDANGIYFVFTSSDVVVNADGGTLYTKYCGFHTWTSYSGVEVKYSLVGDAPLSTLCGSEFPGPNGTSANNRNGTVWGPDSMATVLAHELFETITDPVPGTSWVDSSGNEVGDKCASPNWMFGVKPTGTTYNVTFGTQNFLLQEIWVDANGGACSLYFSGSTGNEHVYSIDTNQHIRELTFPGNLYWVYNDLNYESSVPTPGSPTPNPATASALTSFQDSVGNHLMYLGTNQHIYQMYYAFTSSIDDLWVDQDLTTISGGALAASGSALSGLVNGTQEHVYYEGANNHVYQLVTNSSGQWVEQDVTASASGGVAAVTKSPLSSITGPSYQQVFYLGTNNHVYQLQYSYSSLTWICQDLTALSGAPVVLAATPLTAYINGTQAHVMWLGANTHVYQLVTNAQGAWVYQDLTSTTNGEPTASGTGLSSTFNTTGAFIFYVGTNLHVYQFFYNWSTGVWVDEDLTATTNGALAVANSSLSSFVDTAGEHVMYMGSNNHVYQLYYSYSSKTWVEQDLTSMSSSPVTAIKGSVLTSY